MNDNNNQRSHGPRRHNNNNRHHGPRHHGHHNNRRPHNNAGRPLNSVQVAQKYDQLLEQHMQDRKKYFEFYYRASYDECLRLEQKFYQSIENLRKFENSLESWQKDYLKKKVDRYRLDLTYSTNHELPIEAQVEVSEEQIEDPHFTAAQKEAYQKYKEDTEESVGSIDDYLQYKNLK